LDMGSQFTPFYRAHDPTTQRLDKLTDEISGLREDIKGSHKRMECSFNRLVAIMSQDRRSRSTTSRSSRGRSPALSYIPEVQVQQDKIREEVAEEGHTPTPELTEYAPAEANEMPRDEERDLADETIRWLASTGELDALIGLQRTELTQQQSSQLAYRRGQRESTTDYDLRMSHNAQARITADLRSGVDAATLFERLYPGRRHARFESHSNRRPEQAEPEVRRPDDHQPFQTRQGQQGHPNDPSPPPSKPGDGGPNACDKMPSWRCEARFS
jgi:hypothetical protein